MAIVVTALLVAALAADKPPPAARPPGAPVASLPTVTGEVLEVDHRAHRLRVKTATAELSLAFDRNTLVRGPGGSATPLLITVGERIRVGLDGEARAAWVELKPPPSTPTAAP